MNELGRIASVNVSSGGVPKRPVPGARLSRLGLEGDRQAHPAIHGGPERAVSIYSLELLELLRSEGHTVFPGALGENLTLEGVVLAQLEPGWRLQVGAEVLVEVTMRVKPCQQIASCFKERQFRRIDPDLHPAAARLYARVLREGQVAAGDPVRVRKPS